MTGWKCGFDMNRLRLTGLLAASVAAVLVLLLGASLRTPLFDLWQRLGPRDLSDTQVRVVLIDDESLKALGPWPWPRFYLAKLTQAIGERGAKAIGFDAFFPETDRTGPVRVAELYPDLSPAARAELAGQPSPDQQFALAIGEYPVVLARAGTHEAQGTDAPASDAQLPARLPAGYLSYPRALTAIPELDMVALGHGLANAEPDADGLYRKLPLLARIGDNAVPGLALEVARVAVGADAIGLEGDRVRMGARALPVSERGEMRLRFGRFPEAHTVSAIDLLRPGAGPDLRGTAVLVGLAAAGTSDIAATPIEAKQYGVLVQAQALDAILRGGGWLERPRWAWAVEWGLALALMGLALWLLPRRGRGQWLVPAAGAAVLGGAWLAFDRGALLIDPLPALTLTTASAVAIGLASLQQTRKERERLRETLVEERVTAAANEAELDAARSIQQAMLPRPEALARLDPRVTVAAVLEPARSVGGDFFDVVELGDGRLAFLIADVTGKGVSAALFMALSKALAKSALLREPLASLASTIQREVSRDAPEEMGLTMLVGVLNLATGETQMINAGHENPLLVRAGGEVEMVAMEGGPPFCIVDYPWPVETLRLAAGDMLVLFTDGASEAQDADGRMFGGERVKTAMRGGAPGALVGALVEAVRAFEDGAPPSDDLTVMVLGYRGKVSA